MDIEPIVRKVLSNAIENGAKRGQVRNHEYQLVLYPKNSREVGVIGLIKSKAVAQYKLGDLLGYAYSMMSGIINDFIFKALVRLSKENDISENNCKAFIMFNEKSELSIWVYNGENRVKEIQVKDIING